MSSSQGAPGAWLGLAHGATAFREDGGLAPVEGGRQEREQEESGEAERQDIRDGEVTEKEKEVENFTQLSGFLKEKE